MGRRKDRYDIVHTMYKAGDIITLTDIFQYVSKTVVARDLKMKPTRLNACLQRPVGFTLQEIYRLGGFCGIPERQMYELVENHYFSMKEAMRRSIKNW